ncbi:hypothetical protein GCM10009549_44980 [Streptomyces thermoalcalitolerans]|uniref:Uncharacterized protein n=1 Tax=Streptomyces thermoalcalitolerans TaxID=65605 RepID=A0ABN1P8F1_9ACTN
MVRRLGLRARVGDAVEAGPLGTVGRGLPAVRVGRVHRLLPAGGAVPAALLVLLLVLEVTRVLLVPLLAVVRSLKGVLLAVLLGLPAVAGLLSVPPLAVLRLLQMILRPVSVSGLRARLGLLSSPSAVSVQRIVRMPRFGAWAPAILSHRSPKAARRRHAAW